MRQTAFACVLAAACLPAAAQSLKPGLWEMTNKIGGNPQVDQAMAEMHKQLASMPPDQRKQMEAMMAQRGMAMAPASGGGMAARTCMTREMVERNDVPMQDGCRITSQQRSGNSTKMAFACSNPPSSGEGQFIFHSGEAYSSRMTVKTIVDGRNETMTIEGSGKWLGADCGDVKPLGVLKN